MINWVAKIKGFTPPPQRALPLKTKMKWGAEDSLWKTIIPRNRVGGFTLIEAIVTISIISIVSVFVIANYRGGEKRYIVAGAYHNLLSDLRRGQGMALAPKVYIGYISGVGIHFDLNTPNSYIFFLDKNGDKIFSEGIDYQLQETRLPNRVKIFEIENNFGSIAVADIFFEPPDPIIYINGDKTIGVFAVIKIMFEGTTFTETAKINTTGLIE